MRGVRFVEENKTKDRQNLRCFSGASANSAGNRAPWTDAGDEILILTVEKGGHKWVKLTE
jgi:glycine/serine hydroxymethyltransferase